MWKLFLLTVPLVLTVRLARGFNLTQPYYSGNPQEVDYVFRNSTASNQHLKQLVNKPPLQYLSACSWFNTSANNKYHTLIHYYNNYMFHVATSSENSINQFVLHINREKWMFRVSRPLHDGVWHHVCTTWNGAVGTLAIFLDGDHQGTQTDQDIKGSLHFSGEAVYIGQELNSANDFVRKHAFFGDLSRVNLWDYVLDESDISRLSQSCNESAEGNLLPWTSFVNGNFTVSTRLSTCPLAKGRDCLELLNKGHKLTGYYLIKPNDQSYFGVICDQQTNGGGWVVIQRRQDKSVSFYHNWDTYKLGFGNPHGDFWLGNKNIRQLGQTPTQLLMELRDSKTDGIYEFYKVVILGESNQYGLYILAQVASIQYNSGFSYQTVNSLIGFSTKDRDNDGNARNFANEDMSGFWIDKLYFIDLNSLKNGARFRHKLRKNPKIEIKLRSLRERDNEYALSFEDNLSRIEYPTVKGFQSITVCAWIKAALDQRLQCLFSFYNNDQRFQLCFNAEKLVINLGDETRTVDFTEPPFTISTWNHICFSKKRQNGNWELNLNGTLVKNGNNFTSGLLFHDGSLIIGQKRNNSTSDIEAGSRFIGHLSQFLVLGDYQHPDQALSSSGCQENYGIIPWPEAHLWKQGNVSKYDLVLCKNFKVDHQWNLARDGSKVLQDMPSRDSAVATMKSVDKYNISMDLNVYSSDEKGCVQLGKSQELICLNNPDKCLKGFTVSFWLKYGEKLISRILDKKPKEKNQLESMLAPVTSALSKWSLCYRASKHGWDPKTFHSNCDHKSPTVTIVKVKDFIFGGYTDQIWGNSSLDSSSHSSFLFSLKNPDGCPAFKLNLKTEFKNKANKKRPYLGPVFGLNDLHLGAVSFSNLGLAYDISNISCAHLPNTITRERARKILAGSYSFVPDEIEVFHNVTSQEPGIILSSSKNSLCRLLFRYNEGKYVVKVRNSRWLYKLNVPAIKMSTWSRITITWSSQNGLRFTQDGVKSDAFYMTYGTVCTYSNTYGFLIGCQDTNSIPYTSNFQLSDLKMWDTVLSYKQILENVPLPKTDFFRTGEIMDIAYSKTASSFSSATIDKTVLFQGNRWNHDSAKCFHWDSIHAEPWLEIDLEKRYIICDIFITVYSSYKDNHVRLTKFEVLVSNKPGGENGSRCGTYHSLYKQTHGRIYCEDKPRGRYVRIASKAGQSQYFGMCSVEVKGFRLPGYWLVDSEYPRFKGQKHYYRTDFVLSSKNCLTFFYMLNGTDPGRLNVYLGGYLGKETLLWRLVGYQGEHYSWYKAQVPIAAEIAYQIIFEAIVGTEYAGSIAVDNITLSVEESCSFFPPMARSYVSGMKSNMIRHIPIYQDWLLPALSQAGMWSKYWEPCFHALKDGWNATTFLNNCSGKGPLVFLIRKESRVFGGFTDVNHLNDYVGSSQNYALNRPANQSSDYGSNNLAANAVDNRLETSSNTNSEENPWWRVDLGRPTLVTRVHIVITQMMYDFKILVSHRANGNLSTYSCGGSTLLSIQGSEGSFNCDPPIYGESVEIKIYSSDFTLNMAEVKVYGYQGVPSPKAFLFMFNEKLGSKMELLPGNYEVGTFFTEHGVMFGKGDLVINITARNITNNPGISYQAPPTKGPITGHQHFQPDDLEVLTLGDLLSRSPCLEGEIYDKLINKCLCDFGRRDYELCVFRRVRQNRLDTICRDTYKDELYFARYDRSMESTTKQWRCCGQSALTDDGQRYNITKLSGKCYDRKSVAFFLNVVRYLKLRYHDLFMESAISHWSMDDKNDLKCSKSGLWSPSKDVQNVRGIINKALTFNGSGQIIKLPTQLTVADCLFNPKNCQNGLVVSMWIKFYHKIPSQQQTFWTSQATPTDLGFTVFQPESKSSISVNATLSNVRCTKTISACTGIWFHLMFRYQSTMVNGEDYPHIFINGAKKKLKSTSKSCESWSSSNYQNDYTSIGSVNATLDELVVIKDNISDKMINYVYYYYRGESNVHLNAILLTQQSWSSKLLNKNSDLYQRLASELRTNISQADKDSRIKSFESIKFRKKDGNAAVDLFLSFTGEGYDHMENVVVYLENSYKILDYYSNDVYIKTLNLTYDVNDATITLYFAWSNVSRALTHGVFKRYNVLYKNLNDPMNASHKHVCYDDGLDNVTYYLSRLQYYTTYSISVKLDTYEGGGRYTEPINVTIGVLAPTIAPENVTRSNVSTTSIQVQWSLIPEKYHRGPVSSYVVTCQLVNGSNISTHIVSAPFNVTIIGGLSAYKQYNVSVCGVSIANQTGPCRWTDIWTKTGAPSMPPQALSARSPNSTSINVSWTDIPIDSQHGRIINCHIKWNQANDSQVQTSTIPNQPRVLVLAGLRKYTSYEVRIACSTIAGVGPYSAVTVVRTQEDVAEIAPTILQSYNTSSTSVYLTWEPVLQNSSSLNGILIAYMIQCNTTDDPHTPDVIVCSDALNATVPGLMRHETYSIRIGALTSKGPGVFSSPVNVTTDEDAPETGPSTLNPVSVQSNSLTLSLSPPSDGDANGGVTGYIIKIYDKLRNKVTNITVNTTSLQTLNNIMPYTDYEISVIAYNDKGIGRNATTIEVKTKEGAPSGPPSNVAASPQNGGRVTVSWDAVNAFKVNGIVKSYVIIYYKLSAPDIKYNVTIIVRNSRRKRRSIDSYVLTGLKPYTQYGVQVLAVTVGNGVPSIQFNVTSGQDIPNHYPQNLRSHNISSTSLLVSWDEVPEENKNGIISGYIIMYQSENTVYRVQNVSDGSRRSTTLSGLEKYERYNLTIRAYTIIGSGNISEPAVYAWTGEDAPGGYPVNVTATPTITTLTIKWVAMVKRLENGIIRGYQVSVFEMNGIYKTNATVSASSLTGVATGLEAWTNYTARIRAFTSVGSGPWSLHQRLTTDEQAPQDVPGAVQAHFTSSTSIRVQWNLIDPALTRGIARGYHIYYRALDTPFSKPLLMVKVGANIVQVHVTSLYKYVEYEIYIKAVTNKEGSASKAVKTRTDEDKPGQPPSQLVHLLPSPTSIWLGWYEVNDGYSNGIIQGYKLTYREISTSDPLITKMYTRYDFSSTLFNLPSYVAFEITVRAFTIKGDGPALKQTIRTDEDKPYEVPENLRTENHTSIQTLPVSWDPIPAGGVPGILLGYQFLYKPVSTGDVDIEDGLTKEINLPPHQTRIVLTNLDIYTRYRIVISGRTKKGHGPPAITFGETCYCRKRLTSSWLSFPPYVNVSGDGKVMGIMPSIVKDMVVSCCQFCKHHGLSYLDLYHDGYNQSARKYSIDNVKVMIDGTTDVIFPVPGFESQDSYKTTYGYNRLVDTPGVVFLLSSRSAEGVLSRQMIMSIWEGWPLILFALLFAFLVGIVIWALECQVNEEQFPKSYIKGCWEGFWFTFVSMTTVGYGDRCPTSIPGRILAIFWTLFGVILIGIIVGNIATSITSVAVKQASSLYGMKVGALKNSFEYRFGIRRNARMNTEREYDTYEQIYKDIDDGRITGALLDAFAMGSRKDLFEKPFTRIKAIYDVKFVQGIVIAGNTTKLNRCFRRYTRSNARMISETVKNSVRAVEVTNTPLASEMSSGIFDAGSPVFLLVLKMTLGLLAFLLVVGTIWQAIRFRKSRNVSSDQARLDLVELAKKRNEFFYHRFANAIERLKQKHKQEWLMLKKAKSKRTKPFQNEKGRTYTGTTDDGEPQY